MDELQEGDANGEMVRDLDMGVTAQRIQLRRAKGWRMPANTVKVDRTTLFGNPFSIEDYGHDRAVALHRAWIRGKLRETGISAARRQMLKEQRKRVLSALANAAREESGLLVSTA